jgi:hypothetical protein
MHMLKKILLPVLKARRQELLDRLRKRWDEHVSSPDFSRQQALSKALRALAKFEHDHGDGLPALDDRLALVIETAVGWRGNVVPWSTVEKVLSVVFDR